MTAEIAIMNKMGVALAADSAVTLGHGSKIYNTANKLFMLSKYHPVGIMVYNNSEFMGIPWEIIIKKCRQKFEKKPLDSLREYAKVFFELITKDFSEHHKLFEEQYILSVVSTLYNIIKREYLNNNNISLEDSLHFIDSLLTSYNARCYNDENQDAISKHIEKNYYDKIQCIQKMVFQDFMDSADFSKKINELTIKHFLYFSNNKKLLFSGSGIVIAGYGHKEIFPSLLSYELDGLICNNLKQRITNDVDINFKRNSAIVPFAQKDVVTAFMEGFDPLYREVINNNMFLLIKKIIDTFIQNVAGEPEQLNEIVAKVESAVMSHIDQYFRQFEDYKLQNHIAPIVNAIGALPKDELAAMAESLVNLTSFKRRVSFNQIESVGGPIDVAVISKGDGFTWIKRKLYFKPELNHHFFRNYFEEGEENE